jgi:hypothetical protein
MRHLKTYTLFERVSRETKIFESLSEAKELISVINDMALDIKDKDLRVRIIPVKKNIMDLTDDSHDICFRIEAIWFMQEIQRQRFYLKKIYDELFQIIHFMEDQGWNIQYSNVAGPDGVHSVYIEDGRVIGKWSDGYSSESWEITSPINEITIGFTKSSEKK